MKFNIVLSFTIFFSVSFSCIFHLIHILHPGPRHNHLLPKLLQEPPTSFPYFYLVHIFSLSSLCIPQGLVLTQKLGGGGSYFKMSHHVIRLFKSTRFIKPLGIKTMVFTTAYRSCRSFPTTFTSLTSSSSTIYLSPCSSHSSSHLLVGPTVISDQYSCVMTFTFTVTSRMLFSDSFLTSPSSL